MLARFVAVVVAVLVALAGLAQRADAQLTDIQVYRRGEAGVSAIDMNTPQETYGYDLPADTSRPSRAAVTSPTS